MKTPSSNLWVGAFVRNGALVLFDPKLQAAKNAWVNLYSVSANEIRPYERSIVRQKIRHASPSEYDIAVKAYTEWSQKDNGAFVAGELKAKAKKEISLISSSPADDNLIRRERHQEFLENLGLTGNAKTVEARTNRAANCYSCKCSLSSKSNLECSNCSWLICKCGACGCGYSRH